MRKRNLELEPFSFSLLAVDWALEHPEEAIGRRSVSALFAWMNALSRFLSESVAKDSSEPRGACLSFGDWGEKNKLLVPSLLWDDSLLIVNGDNEEVAFDGFCELWAEFRKERTVKEVEIQEMESALGCKMDDSFFSAKSGCSALGSADGDREMEYMLLDMNRGPAMFTGRTSMLSLWHYIRGYDYFLRILGAKFSRDLLGEFEVWLWKLKGLSGFDNICTHKLFSARSGNEFGAVHGFLVFVKYFYLWTGSRDMGPQPLHRRRLR